MKAPLLGRKQQTSWLRTSLIRTLLGRWAYRAYATARIFSGGPFVIQGAAGS
jgi:hypothetical protein